MSGKDANPVQEFGENLKQLAEDLGVLLRRDLEDARAEMVEKAKSAGMGAGMLGGSALTGLLALFSATVLAIALLAAVLPLWAAAAIVTAFWGVATAALALGGKKKLADAGPPIPERAIKNLAHDLKAAKKVI